MSVTLGTPAASSSPHLHAFVLLSLLEQAWQDHGQIVADNPIGIPHSHAAVSIAGATGQESSKDTGLRFGVEGRPANSIAPLGPPAP